MSRVIRKRVKPGATTAYLVSFNNGQDYEDRRTHPLFLVPTRAQADAIVAEAAQWIEEQRENLPPCPIDVDRERAAAEQEFMTPEELCALSEARSAHINALKPPYGITSLLEAVEPNQCGSHGHLTVTEIAYLTPDWREDS